MYTTSNNNHGLLSFYPFERKINEKFHLETMIIFNTKVSCHNFNKKNCSIFLLKLLFKNSRIEFEPFSRRNCSFIFTQMEKI